MFICERNNIGCVSISSNWVEFECFSDRTRCIWKDGALEGGESGREGEAIMMKESSKSVCLLFLASHLKKEIKLLLQHCSSSKLLCDKCSINVTFAFKLIF